MGSGPTSDLAGLESAHARITDAISDAAAVGEGAREAATLHALLAEDADRPTKVLAVGSA